MAKKMTDTVAEFDGVTIIHQKIPGHEVGRHSHNEHEFFMPLQGDITVQHGETTVKAGPGRMLYVPPNLDHDFSSTATGSGERVIWLIENRVWNKHTKTNFVAASIPTNFLAKEILFYLLIHQKSKGAKYFVSALIEALADSLAGAQIKKNLIFIEHIEGKIKDERVRKAIHIFNENLNISIPEVAVQSGLSQRNFSRLFLQEAGISPKDYLILSRVDKAKTLLKETRMTVTDISLEVGYNSLSKFIETFRKMEGLLPSDFRNKKD